MKKIFYLLPLVLLILLIFNVTIVNAVSRSVSFVGEPVILNDYTDIEILNNEVVINEDTSEISNKMIFKNNSSTELVREGTIKLEDPSIGLKITDLHIVINGLEVESYTKDENENYKFYFTINANEGKEISITYKTSSSLQDAKIIKYSMDKIKGKHVDRLFFKVIMNKYDIALVEKIWPGAYEFENNEIYTEYIDFNVNNLTKDIIIQKETYNNLKYGENNDSLDEEQEYILQNYKEIIDGNINKSIDKYEKLDSFREILKYAYTLKNEKSYYERDYSYGEQFNNYSDGNPLVDQLMFRNKTEVKLSSDTGNGLTDSVKTYPFSSGNKIAINYHESEEGKDLYIIKDISNSYHSVEHYEPMALKKDEYTILRTIVNHGAPVLAGAYGGEKFIYVNSDIDGNKIDISEEEIVDFVNMVNVDLYVRKVLYDPSETYPDVLIGYYNDNSRSIAKGFLHLDAKIEAYNKNIELLKQGKGYEYLDEAGRAKRIDDVKGIINNMEKTIRVFDNDTIKNNCKVPVLAECIGKVEFLSADEIREKTIGREIASDGIHDIDIDSKYTSSEGQYVVNFNGGFGDKSLCFYPAALNTKEAKQLKADNQAKNEENKNKINEKINSVTLTKDTEEYVPKAEELKEIEKSKQDNNLISNINIILAAIISIIVLLLIFFIYNVAKVIKSKRG